MLLNLGEARPWMLRDFGEDGREEGSIAGLESILVTVLDTVFFFFFLLDGITDIIKT